MAYFKPVIDETGLHLPTYQDVLDYLNEHARTIFGNDIYLEPDSQDYQANAEIADLWVDLANLVQQTYNNRSIQFAQGVALDGLLKINGLKRLPATKSVCTVTLTGSPGTAVNGGLISDQSGINIWSVENTVIPESGSIDVTATCQTDGDIYADAGTLNKIVTQTNGWLAVINNSNAVPGKPTESDPSAKARQTTSTARPSKTVLQGLSSGIAEISNVRRYKIYENNTGESDENGIPAHCICCVVEGGNPEEIGNEIYLRKTPGCDTYGDINIIVTPPNPMFDDPPPVRFYRPVYIEIYVRISIKQRAGYVDTLANNIKQAVSNFINSLDIGEDVSASLLGTIAQSVAVNLHAPAFTLDPFAPVLTGTNINNLAKSDINITFNAAAQCTPDNVEVVSV